jgi:hypothetical protein
VGRSHSPWPALRGAIAGFVKRACIFAGAAGCNVADQPLHPDEIEREIMRAEIEKLVEEIKQSVGLLRRHL